MGALVLNKSYIFITIRRQKICSGQIVKIIVNSGILNPPNVICSALITGSVKNKVV